MSQVGVFIKRVVKFRGNVRARDCSKLKLIVITRLCL